VFLAKPRPTHHSILLSCGKPAKLLKDTLLQSGLQSTFLLFNNIIKIIE